MKPTGSTRSGGPRPARWVVERLLWSDDAERLLADLDDEYDEYQCRRRGRWRADLWYWQQALRSAWIIRRRRGRLAARPPENGRRALDLLVAMIRDIRYGARALSAAPTFTATAVLTLALGIGATTAIFSIVNAVLLRSLPYDEPERIVRAWANEDDGDIENFSFRVVEYRELVGRTDVFEVVGAEFPVSFAVLVPDREPRQVQGRMVTPGFFRVFGTRPRLGRMFGAEEIDAGDLRVAVVSHGFWARDLASDPAAVGGPIDLDGVSFTLIGVLPADYRHVSGDDAEVFIPYTIGTSRWTGHWLDLYARLQAGIRLPRAAEEITAVMRGISAADGRTPAWHASVQGLQEMVVGDVDAAVWATFATAALVLAIACVNVTSLTLARATMRVPEVAVRKALGADRSRIVRYLLAESFLVAVAGGASGVVAAIVGLRIMLSLAPPTIPRLGDATIDTTVLTFCLGISGTAGLVSGLVPALGVAGGDPAADLRQRSRSTTPGARRRLLGSLVVWEVALALTLLVGAGLMVRTMQELQRQDLGFHKGGALTFRVGAPAARWPGSEGSDSFYQQLRAGLLALPGVTAVGAGTDLPLSGQGAVAGVTSEPRLGAGFVEGVTTLQRRATAGFIEALGIPLLAGRGFDQTDRSDSETVVMISDSLARRLFPGESAVGRRVAFGDRQPDEDAWMRVVGVVADVRFQRPDAVDYPQVYQAHPQSASREMSIVIRTTDDPLALVEPAREVLRTVDPQVPIYEIATLEDLVDRALSGRRFTMSVFALFAGVALVLTIAGIYGVLSFVVGRRRREMGVRMALGARSEDVMRLVVREGMTLIALGLILGLVAASGATRLLGGLVYGVSTTDSSTYVAVLLILAVVGLAACYFPARQGARVHPMAILRQE